MHDIEMKHLFRRDRAHRLYFVWNLPQFHVIIALINQDGFFPTLLGNTFWLVALGYYIYITFLGYSGK